MDLLVEDGHVIATRLEIKNKKPDVRFARVGRNSASTFTGFCAEHDAEIFRPIDTRPFDEKDAEQLFLLAYRSVTRELHANMQAAVRIQSGYQDRVKRQLAPKNKPSVSGIMAIEQFAKSHEAFRYRAEAFDIPSLRGDVATLAHDVLTLDGQVPTIAVSSLFSLPYIEREGELVRCILNVFPVSRTQTKVVFSYTEKESGDCRTFLNNILGVDGEERRFELSRLILRRTENFILSPKFHSSWSQAKAAVILKAFTDTIMNEDDVSRHPDLMLF